jgi:hypothetical protein
MTQDEPSDDVGCKLPSRPTPSAQALNRPMFFYYREHVKLKATVLLERRKIIVTWPE